MCKQILEVAKSRLAAWQNVSRTELLFHIDQAEELTGLRRNYFWEFVNSSPSFLLLPRMPLF